MGLAQGALDDHVYRSGARRSGALIRAYARNKPAILGVVLVIVVLSEVFREGARLRGEAELTI